MTKIKTGALSNLGAGLFFIYGAGLTLFAPLPFESFILALAFGLVPMLGFFSLAYKGYKVDRKNYGIQSSRNGTCGWTDCCAVRPFARR